MSEAIDYDPYAMPPDAVREPPQSLWNALKMIGPGIILAGTIVGSGELLATTLLGAQRGFTFLWLILYSCVIKVFVQIELGRYAISSGKPTLGALNDVPGPRFGSHILVWWWLFMMLTTIFQLGAMTGGVSQSLNLAFPAIASSIAGGLQNVWNYGAQEITTRPEIPWTFVTCATAIGLLWTGNYKRIERVTTILVVGVTLLTLTATIFLVATPYPIRWNEVWDGLFINFKDMDAKSLFLAFGIFGITGVGATELFYYPYWCLEKGYARYVGIDDGSKAWEGRAKGWIRVMYLDAWASMIVFTVSTVAFYFMGASVLQPQGLQPEGPAMIGTLSRMFRDTFGTWTVIVFLIGAGAVLFKTLYLASAANARLLTDFLSLSKFVRFSKADQRAKYIHWISLVLPVLAMLLFLLFGNPGQMVAIGGFAQAVTLPMISIVTLYFRYRRTDKRLAPSIAWDIVLWIAVVSITILVSLYSFSIFCEKILGIKLV